MIFKDITDTYFEGIQISSHNEFEHEKVYYYEDHKSGLKSLIAIHDSTEGPAIGGCRFKTYDSFESGLNDVLRLSRGMTHKNSVAKVPFGGGKGIIFKEGKKSNEMLKSYADFLNLLEGKYISAEDIGISLNDIRFIKQHTEYVFDNVDPGPYTAKGIFYAIKRAISFTFSESLVGKKIAIQGAGSVGSKLADHLSKAGAIVYISDIDNSKLKIISDPNITIVDNAFEMQCDVFSPCAVGAIFSRSSIEKLNCKIIAGGANNQLLNESVADDLHANGITYIPDILINSGGVIGLTKDIMGRNEEQAELELMNIAIRVEEAMAIAKDQSISIQAALKFN